MKNYLLSWYGITDLRAAVGLESSDGPLLSALKTNEYTDLVLLAYTDASKVPAPPSGDPVSAFNAMKNTPLAHQTFVQWLDHSLTEIGLNVRIHVLPQELSHLNDATGIHAGATAAVRFGLADSVSPRLTAHVSPGTPVMAYTWALIARSNPQLGIRVISSSASGLPPETIDLPRSLLDTAIAAPESGAVDTPAYDLVIHLLGEQVMPIFFALRQFPGGRHVVLTTQDYVEEVERLANVSELDNDPVLIKNPFKPAETRKAIASLITDLPAESRIAVNMTGGTKLMFAGALSACWELGLDPFYFEIRHHNVIFLRDGSQVPFVGISNVDDFLRAGNHRIVTHGKWPVEENAHKNVRQSAVSEMWERRDSLRSLYQNKAFLDFSRNYNRHQPPYERDTLPFAFTWGSGEASKTDQGDTKLVLKGTPISMPKKDFFGTLSGGWLEEYVYSLLRPLQDEGLIRDVRVGMEVGFQQVVAAKHEMPAQEFDCAFTDGKRLWIVECKAGVVKQDAIQKLENNLRQYGGVAARGLFVSGLPLNDANQRRIDSIPSITAVHPDHLSTDMLRLIIQTA